MDTLAFAILLVSALLPAFAYPIHAPALCAFVDARRARLWARALIGASLVAMLVTTARAPFWPGGSSLAIAAIVLCGSLVVVWGSRAVIPEKARERARTYGVRVFAPAVACSFLFLGGALALGASVWATG